MGALLLVPDGEPAVAEQPGDRPLDLPAVPAEPLARLDPRTRDARDDPSLSQPGKVFGGEVRLVRAEFDGPTPPWSASGADGGYASDQRLEGQTVVGVRTGHGDGEWDALGLGQYVQLAALLAAIDRVRPGQGAPFLARTEAASTIAEAQSSSPRAPSSSRTALWSRRHSPIRVHAVNRRWAVAGETPNVSGRCRQAQPLVSTYTIAVNTARSSQGAVPPPCGRELNDGSNGATSSHRPSGTSRRDRSIPTSGNDAAAHHVRHPLRVVANIWAAGHPPPSASHGRI